MNTSTWTKGRSTPPSLARRPHPHTTAPGDEATLGFTILTFGGPALFLLAQTFFLAEAVGSVPRSRPLGLAALAILAVATAPLPLIAGIAAAAAVLVAVAIADTVATRG
ncbi:MAG: hypothetical protein ACRDLN_01840 [Solirubrobacteraceae bacterium]